MKSRNSHVAKTMGQKQAYNQYIQRLDYSPTIDETLPFQNSSQSGEELSEPTSKRKRPLNTSERFADHFKNNWLDWVIGLVAVVLIWLTTDSKIDMARVNIKLENQHDSISDVNQSSQKNTEINHEQDLKIIEHKFRIEALEKQSAISGTEHKTAPKKK